MNLDQVIKNAEAGKIVLVGDIIQEKGVNSVMTVRHIDPDSLATVGRYVRCCFLLATRAYLLLVEHGDETLQHAGGFGDISQGEEFDKIIEHLRKGLAFMEGMWPAEGRLIKRMVRDLKTAKMCFYPDPLPQGLKNFPALYPQGWKGNFLRLMSDVAPHGRIPTLLQVGPRQYAMDESECPTFEGGFLSYNDFALPPTHGEKG